MLRTANTWKLRSRLSDDRRALVEDLMPLAVHVANRFANTYGIDRRELISVAYEAMVDHAELFDPALGTAKKFFSFRVQAALRDHLDNESLAFRRLPCTAHIAWEQPDHRRADILAFDDRSDARWLIRRANVKDRKALRSVYLHGRTYDETARHLGVCLSTVSGKIHRGLADIRSSLASRGA